MKNKLRTFLICSFLSIMLMPLMAEDVLTPHPSVELTGTKGKFDFIKIDSSHNRLLACHSGNGSLDVIDLTTAKLIKSVPTGVAQGVAVDSVNHRYYVSASKPPQLVIVDAGTLEVTGQIPLPDAADLVACSPSTNRVFVCNDEKPEVWVIDPVAKTILSTITFPSGGMEDLFIDASGAFLYQCLKDSNELAKVDLKEGKVVAKWSTSPADKPHGMEQIPGTDTCLIVGGAGKLVLLNFAKGQVVASTDIVPKVDEIAYDAVQKRVYCASGSGAISVVTVDNEKLTTLAPLTSSPGAHSIAVDPRTHSIWIAFAKDDKAYVQAFTLK